MKQLLISGVLQFIITFGTAMIAVTQAGGLNLESTIVAFFGALVVCAKDIQSQRANPPKSTSQQGHNLRFKYGHKYNDQEHQ